MKAERPLSTLRLVSGSLRQHAKQPIALIEFRIPQSPNLPEREHDMEMSEIPEPVEVTATPTPAAAPETSSKRTAFIGAMVGMAALAGTIVGVGAIANAQDDTEPTAAVESAAADDTDEGEDRDLDADTSDLFDPDFVAFEECMAEQLGDLWIEPEFMADELPKDEQKFIDADAVCSEFLPEDVKAEIEAWRPYEECVDNQVGDLDDTWVNGSEPSDADWEAYDAAREAADQACRDLLPADVQAEMAVWDEFDQCLNDAGVGDDEAFGLSSIHIETGDGFQVAEFGDENGSVTISGTAGNLSVTSDGGVTILDEAAMDAQWEEIDAAHEACEQLLPEEFQMEFGDFDK